MIITIEEISELSEKQLPIVFDEVINELDNNIPVKANLTVKDLGNRIIIQGDLNTDINLQCDRCLGSFKYHVDAKINETFLKGSLETSSKKEVELTENSFLEELNGDDKINLTDFIYQEVVLNIPNKKLCSSSCDADGYFSDSEEKPIDPRLAVFKTYFDNNDDN